MSTFEQRKAKAEELRCLRDRFDLAQEFRNNEEDRESVSDHIMRFFERNPTEQWYLEAVEEIERLKNREVKRCADCDCDYIEP